MTLDCTERFCLLFKTAKLSAKEDLQYCIPTAINESFCCSGSSPALGIVSFQDFNHSDRCVRLSLCLNLHLLNDNVEHFFLCLFPICILSLVKCLFRSCTYFYIELFVSFLLSFKSILYILDTSTPSDICFKYISPNLWLVSVFS